MGTAPVTARDVACLDRPGPALRRFEEEWRQGRPDLTQHLTDAGGAGSVSMIASLVKLDLRGRYDLGERPEVAEYLDRFPELIASGERVLSLIYEEFCLREEHNERPDADEFCTRYGPWKDSLETQLRYHRVLSRAVGGAQTPERFPSAGERFGPFLIGTELGRGQAGRVYLARDESLGGREVALKVTQDRGSEPATLGRLNHPHIVPVLSVAFVDREGTRLRGLCMTYRPGLPLDEVIRQADPASRPARAGALIKGLGLATNGGPLANGSGWEAYPSRGTFAEGVAWVVAVLAEALAHAHARGIFHRDVKPANVLLTATGGPQLLDFNLSHDPHSAVEAEAALRGGTLPYMAPEQLAAFLDPGLWHQVVSAADLYSLGLLLREMLTGRQPEPPDPSLPLTRSIRALLDRRADFEADLRGFNPRVPHALDAIARRCLAFAPADRYQDAGALAEDLRRFLDRRPLKYALNPSWRERAANPVVRHRTPMASAVVVAALAATALWTPGVGPDRPKFSEAVIELDAGRGETALDLLRRLGPVERRSPLVVFYTAAAHARCGRAREADEALERVGPWTEAEVELTEWGRSHPDLARHAEQLAVVLLASAPRVEPSRKSAILDRAGQTFRLVLRLNPARYRAMEGLAVVEEGRGRFAPAHDYLTAVISSPDEPGSTARRQHLADLLLIRARVSTRWAGTFPPTHPARERHLKEALDDLERCDRVAPPGRGEGLFNRKYIHCETMLAFAGVTAARGDLARAVDYYGQAGRLLDTIASHPAGKESAYRVLETKVKDRLRIEIPRLTRRVEVTSDPRQIEFGKE